MLNTEVSTIAASISSVQTKELDNGNHQISRGKFDPVQYCAYFGERKYFESTFIGRFPQRQISSHLIPCYNHLTTAGNLIALSDLSDQLDTTGYHTGSLMKAIRLSAEVVLRIFKGVNAF